MRSVERAVSVEDLRRMAEAWLPGVVFDFVDAGSEAGQTLSENRFAFQSVKFRPRAAVATASRQLGTTVLGDALDFPVVVAPCGGARLLRSAGELALSAAAHQAGTAYVIPHVAGYAMENIRAQTTGPLWYQLYPYGGPEVVEATIERVERCGIRTLVITVDTAAGANFENSLRRGLTALSAGDWRGSLPHFPQFVIRPGWARDYLMGGYRLAMPNVRRANGQILSHGDLYAGRVPGVPPFTWSDIRKLRDRFSGSIVLKGILTGEDARRAVDVGASAIVVSNHGGRMLDGSVATLPALGEVVEAAGDQAEILLDGGVRRGSDVVKALCLGARAVLVGRASLYGLAAGGQAGVRRALTLIRNDVARCMAFLGCQTLDDLNPSLLQMPSGWPSPPSRPRQHASPRCGEAADSRPGIAAQDPPPRHREADVSEAVIAGTPVELPETDTPALLTQ